MQDMTTMLSRLQNISGYDIRLVNISPTYVKLEQRVSLHPSYTLKKLVQTHFPWIDLHDIDFTIGFGICANNEPQAMTWNRGRVIMNAEIQDLWPNTTLSAHEECLIVCCMFSRAQYKLQKDRLDVVLEAMGKWIPPS
jgi:hypothetical protein